MKTRTIAMNTEYTTLNNNYNREEIDQKFMIADEKTLTQLHELREELDAYLEVEFSYFLEKINRLEKSLDKANKAIIWLGAMLGLLSFAVVVLLYVL